MAGLTYEQIAAKIIAQSGLKKEQVDGKVNEKLKQLSNLISKEGAAHIVANELGVKVFEAAKTGRLKIKELQPLQRNVEIVGRILKIYGIRSFKTEKKEGRNGSFLIGDETGRVRVTVWDEPILPEVEKAAEGDIVLLKNAYIRENNGFREVHLGSGGQIVLNPHGETVGEIGESRLEAVRRQIVDLQQNEFATITGTVVQVFEPRFYEACSECGKKVNPEDGKCREHGAVEKMLMPVVNVIFDDGTENIRIVCFREQSEAMLGLSREALVALKDNFAAFDEVRSKVLGKQLTITGRVNKNEMFDRLEMVANSIEEAKPEQIMASLAAEEKVLDS